MNDDTNTDNDALLAPLMKLYNSASLHSSSNGSSRNTASRTSKGTTKHAANKHKARRDEMEERVRSIATTP